MRHEFSIAEIYSLQLQEEKAALVRLIPRASLLVGCQGSHGHIRIPLDVSITGDRSSCFVADFFFDCFSKNNFF